tara:strand:- start:6364 stop:6822 length:459 start_codon:yes stop_codon:yes gene_type:complete
MRERKHELQACLSGSFAVRMDAAMILRLASATDYTLHLHAKTIEVIQMNKVNKAILLTSAMFFGLGSGALMADDDVRLDEANSLIEQGTIKKFDELNEKALSVQPGTITDTDLDKHYGRYVYQVEIKDAQGQEWDVDLDASNGEVLEHKQDD